MITQERVLEFYENANPIKDPESLTADLKAAGYLATLEQRSSEVTQLGTKNTETSVRTSSRRTWIAAAAAFVAGISVALVLPGQLGGDTASSGDEAGRIAFAVTNTVEDKPLFAANGPAVEAGLICGTATGRWRQAEDSEGNVLEDWQITELWNRGTPHVYADVFDMLCDDGSGSFTLRIFGEIDPSDPDYSPETAEHTWTITGRSNYEGLSGEGVGSGEQNAFDVAVRSGSGRLIIDE